MTHSPKANDRSTMRFPEHVLDRLAIVFGWGCCYYVTPRHGDKCRLCGFPWAAHVPFWARRIWRTSR